MNKMRGNKLSLLFSKLMNKMGRTHILCLVLGQLAQSCPMPTVTFLKLGAFMLMSFGAKCNEVIFWLDSFTLAFFTILFYQNKTKSTFWRDFYA